MQENEDYKGLKSRDQSTLASYGSSSLDSGRRGLLQAVAATGLAIGTFPHVALAESKEPYVTTQPSPSGEGNENTSDFLIETLITWGVTHVFGIVGDGINPIIEALRKRQDRITYVNVRHEEAAAFMASAFAKHTGRLGVCLATTGPGAAHLVNGLYDAKYDNAPVVALTGSTFRDLEGMRFMQGIDTVRMLEDVALFNEQVNSPGHAVLLVNRACRAALAGRGVAHLTVPKDVQGQALSSDKPSLENHGGRTSSAWLPVAGLPPASQIRMAADVLNAGSRVAILAGSGCFPAVPQLRRLAERWARQLPRPISPKRCCRMTTR